MADQTEFERAKQASRDRESLGTRWIEENRAAISSYNKRVVEHGLLSDDMGLLATSPTSSPG